MYNNYFGGHVPFSEIFNLLMPFSTVIPYIKFKFVS